MATTVVSTSCANGVSVNADVGYTPPFLPITLTIDTNGNIAIHGNASIVTPVGTFTVAADVSKGLAGTSGNTLLIIRHRKGGSIVDDVYTVQSDKITVIVDGLTELVVTNGRVFLDATKAHIRSIEIRSSGGTPPPQPVATTLPFTDPLTSAQHAEGWPNGPYYPPPGDGADPAIYCGFTSQGLQVGPSLPSDN
jgi:hypothetical protein